ncbi:MAG: hypothetical protein KF756_13460 [Acidobacteria bacterium]|nr:hypothetical protein [Acidobacteriota bacterium]
MKKTLLFVTAAFVVALSITAASAQEKFSKVVTDADRWDAIEYSAPPECSLSPEECAVKMLTELKIDVGSEPKFSVYPLGETNDGNVTVVFVSRFVDDDELVLGKLFRLELERSDAADTSYSLDGLGVMFQCMNGPVGWRKTPCQ